jgi:hypothetical protein
MAHRCTARAAACPHSATADTVVYVTRGSRAALRNRAPLDSVIGPAQATLVARRSKQHFSHCRNEGLTARR